MGISGIHSRPKAQRQRQSRGLFPMSQVAGEDGFPLHVQQHQSRLRKIAGLIDIGKRGCRLLALLGSRAMFAFAPLLGQMAAKTWMAGTSPAMTWRVVDHFNNGYYSSTLRTSVFMGTSLRRRCARRMPVSK